MNTNKIKSFDKANLRELRGEIDNALNSVASKYGIKLTISNISFSADNFRTKLEGKCTVVNESGVTVVKLPHHVPETFTYNGKTWKVVDYKPRNTKYPIIAVKINDVDNRRFKLPSSVINGQLKPYDPNWPNRKN
jgi:hypothetical protein